MPHFYWSDRLVQSGHEHACDFLADGSVEYDARLQRPQYRFTQNRFPLTVAIRFRSS